MKRSIWEEMKKWLQLTNKAGNKQKYLLFLLLMGITLMLISKMIESPEKPTSMPAFNNSEDTKSDAVFKATKGVTNKNIRSYEERYAAELKDLLEQLQGVESVSVMVDLETTELNRYANNESTQRQTTSETDKSGGKRTIEDQKVDEKVVIIQNGGKEEPLIVTTEKPRIRGVAVVAEGAENLKTKAMIIDVITKVFDIGSNSVSVWPKKNEGE